MKIYISTSDNGEVSVYSDQKDLEVTVVDIRLESEKIYNVHKVDPAQVIPVIEMHDDVRDAILKKGVFKEG